MRNVGSVLGTGARSLEREGNELASIFTSLESGLRMRSILLRKLQTRVYRLGRRVFGKIGMDLRPARGSRANMGEAVRHLAERGFQPRTVIDVGVARGTDDLYETFPAVKHLLIEPIAEFEPYMRKISSKYDCELVLAAAASKESELTIDVRSDASWSSLYEPLSEFGVERTPRRVRTVRVDTVCKQKGLCGPYLLKVDVEGAELEVLEGATGILDQTEVIILEMTFPEEYVEAPSFADVIRYMCQKGYVAYDIFDLRAWTPDNILHQGDFVFVKRDGFFRKGTSGPRA